MGLGSGILDPGSRINLFRIPDPGQGVKKAPDPGSGSATLPEPFHNTTRYWIIALGQGEITTSRGLTQSCTGSRGVQNRVVCKT
jgi:hypothetical protein